MSLKFDRYANQFRVFLPTVKRLPRLPMNPQIGQGAALQHRPAETADTESELSPEDSLQYRLLACDQRSFVTGSASADLQASRIIKDINTDQVRKRELEAYLSQQRLQEPSRLIFLLDSPTNAILLEPSLHVQWDIYGTFCIVPSESDAATMLDALNNINDKWAEYDSIECPARPLDVTQPPFAQPHWDIVVLHPHAFLPESQPLAIAFDRTYSQGLPSQPVSSLTWTSWIAEGDRLCSASPSRTPLTPFVVDNIRSVMQKPILSSLAMVINAHSKLDQFIRNHRSSATPRVQRFAQLMSDLVTAIFFVPQGYPQPWDHPSHSMTGVVPSQSASVLNAPLFPIADSPEAAHDKGNTGDGLTDLEFQIVAARANDSFLDPKQRADAAMMMLYGTRLKSRT